MEKQEIINSWQLRRLFIENCEALNKK